ncbi:MAG TPA: hypothetical protein VEF33_07180 [Syntrophales bacterium]|nr:hypothetical protein [Syntrophales bacterium]
MVRQAHHDSILACPERVEGRAEAHRSRRRPRADGDQRFSTVS